MSAGLRGALSSTPVNPTPRPSKLATISAGGRLPCSVCSMEVPTALLSGLVLGSCSFSSGSSFDLGALSPQPWSQSGVLGGSGVPASDWRGGEVSCGEGGFSGGGRDSGCGSVSRDDDHEDRGGGGDHEAGGEHPRASGH